MNKIKILHIIKSLGRGGAEMLLPETLKVHDQEFFEFHYIYFLPCKNQLVEAIETAGGKVSCFSANNNLMLLLQYPKIIKYCRKHKIQLIHAHLPWAGIVARIAGYLVKIPVIYTEHNNFNRYHFATRLLSTLTYQWQSLVIAVSEEVKKVIEDRKLFSKVIYQPNGVNADFFKKANRPQENRELDSIVKNKKVIGTVAVFRPQKRLDLFLKMAKELYRLDSNYVFLLVGDGPEAQKLRAIKEKESLDYVHFMGLQENPKTILQYLDGFVITSDFEGLPVALLEAMSMEIIPFCRNVGGIGAVIKNNKNGILLENANPNQMATIIHEVFESDETTLNNLGKEARNTIMDNYSIQTMVSGLENIYLIYVIDENNLYKGGR
ncbi:MAG: glycosyltransferase [Flavobacteriaceae bacterium]|nr:glycosyltransferase [Flavobacteriaceae bacterium]